MRSRDPRYGMHTYEVKVTPEVAQYGLLYTKADSIAVVGGALFLLAEIDTPEAKAEKGDPNPMEHSELAISTIVPAGHWFSAIIVDPEDLRPTFGIDHPKA